MTGTITTVYIAKGYGFISVPGDSDLFFHHTCLADDLEFDEQLIERRVQFEQITTSKGDRAENVRAAD